MKVYHQFRKERGVGAVSVATFLIGHLAFYTPNKKSKNLNSVLGQAYLSSEVCQPFYAWGGFSGVYI
jgi:hypothetical protein